MRELVWACILLLALASPVVGTTQPLPRPYHFYAWNPNTNETVDWGNGPERFPITTAAFAGNREQWDALHDFDGHRIAWISKEGVEHWLFTQEGPNEKPARRNIQLDSAEAPEAITIGREAVYVLVRGTETPGAGHDDPSEIERVLMTFPHDGAASPAAVVPTDRLQPVLGHGLFAWATRNASAPEDFRIFILDVDSGEFLMENSTAPPQSLPLVGVGRDGVLFSPKAYQHMSMDGVQRKFVAPSNASYRLDVDRGNVFWVEFETVHHMRAPGAEAKVSVVAINSTGPMPSKRAPYPPIYPIRAANGQAMLAAWDSESVPGPFLGGWLALMVPFVVILLVGAVFFVALFLLRTPRRKS